MTKMKAITPVISIFLIITVLLGIILTTYYFLSSTVETSQESIEKGYVNFLCNMDTFNSKIEADACVYSNKVKMDITNTGYNNIEGFSFKINSENDEDFSIVNKGLGRGHTDTFEAKFDLSIGIPNMVDIYVDSTSSEGRISCWKNSYPIESCIEIPNFQNGYEDWPEELFTFVNSNRTIQSSEDVYGQGPANPPDVMVSIMYGNATENETYYEAEMKSMHFEIDETAECIQYRLRVNISRGTTVCGLKYYPNNSIAKIFEEFDHETYEELEVKGRKNVSALRGELVYVFHNITGIFNESLPQYAAFSSVCYDPSCNTTCII